MCYCLSFLVLQSFCREREREREREMVALPHGVVGWSAVCGFCIS